MTSRNWHAPPIAKVSTAAMNGFSRRLSSTASSAAEIVPAVHLRDPAELALEHELEQRDLALIEVGEIDARAEDAPARVLRVGGGRAAQHTDADGVVEQHEIDGHLERRDRDVVLRVEMGVVLDRHVADFAVAVDPDRAEVGLAVPPEVVQQRERRRRGLRHRVQEMEARALVREDVGDEHALVDLESRLVLLRQLALGVDRGATREVIREALRRCVDELRDARPRAEVVRERAVDRLRCRCRAAPAHARSASRRGADHASARGRSSITRESLPPSERGSEPGRDDGTAIVQPMLSLIRPETRPRSAWSA